MKSVFVEEKTLDSMWFTLLSELYKHGRKNHIDNGSFAGSNRLEFDYVAGTIEFPTTKPLAPIVPDGVPPVTTDEEIEKYFINYLMDGHNLEGNEHYRYATWISGGKYKIPKFMRGIDVHRLNGSYEVMVPNQVQWCIDHYKSKGHGNNHCYIQVGYPESSFAYDIPWKTEDERQTSPCVLPDVDIITIEGNKRADEIKVDDMVFTHKGNWKKVKKIYKRQYNGDIQNIRLGGFNRNLKLTKDHPIFSINADYCPYDKKLKCKPNCSKQYSCYEKAGKICKKIYKNYLVDWHDSENINHLNYILFPKIKEGYKCPYDNEEMYLFGLFLADGDYKGGIRFNLGSHEKELIENVILLMKKVYNLRPHISFSNKNNSGIRLVFYSAKLERKYRELFGHGARTKNIIKDFLFYEKDSLCELIKGYIDGDGYIKKTQEKSFYTSSRNLRDKFLLMLIKIGYTFTTSKRKAKDGCIDGRIIKSNGLGYVIEIKENKKQNIFWQDDDYMYFPVKYNKKEKYSGFVYNYEVEDDNSYIANNFPVHNCLRGIDTHIKDGQLCFAVVFRSWALYAGFPENMGGITMLMEYMAEQIGVKPGPLSFSCLKLHAYDYELDAVRARLNI